MLRILVIAPTLLPAINGWLEPHKIYADLNRSPVIGEWDPPVGFLFAWLKAFNLYEEIQDVSPGGVTIRLVLMARWDFVFTEKSMSAEDVAKMLTSLEFGLLIH